MPLTELDIKRLASGAYSFTFLAYPTQVTERWIVYDKSLRSKIDRKGMRVPTWIGIGLGTENFEKGGIEIVAMVEIKETSK